jgi:phospholipid/cholesterol/gamma-HCH transport system substrate-binding protein
MTQESMRFRLGIFVLAALVLLGFMVIMFGSYPSFLFKKPNSYTILFSDAAGVDNGTPVRRSGIHIGEVTKVELDNETGMVRVTIAIDPRYTIYQDETPVLSHSVLGGDTTIDFVPNNPTSGSATSSVNVQLAQVGREPVADNPPGSKEHVPVPPGTELRGKSQQDLVASLSQTLPAATAALDRLSKSIEKVDRILPAAEESMKEFNNLSKDTRVFIGELRNTNKELNGIAKDVHGMVPDVKRTNDEMYVAARNFGKLSERLDVLVQANQDKMERILDQISDDLNRVAAVLSEENRKNVATILRNVKSGSDHLDELARGSEELLRESQKVVKRLDGTVQRADDVFRNLQTATKPIADHSDSTMRNLDEGSAKFNKSMTDLQALISSFTTGNGTLGKLLNDPSLYNHLDEAAGQANKVMSQIQYVIKDLGVFADKLARHPEVIGVKGAVEKNTGIKETNPGQPSLGVPR